MLVVRQRIPREIWKIRDVWRRKLEGEKEGKGEVVEGKESRTVHWDDGEAAEDVVRNEDTARGQPEPEMSERKRGKMPVRD